LKTGDCCSEVVVNTGLTVLAFQCCAIINTVPDVFTNFSIIIKGTTIGMPIIHGPFLEVIIDYQFAKLCVLAGTFSLSQEPMLS
jgi:hypothetical protein